MNVFVNRGEGGYVPFRPKDPTILTNRGVPVSPIESDGLFYIRPDTTKEGFKTIADYQRWVESGWKAEHGTLAAAERFADKAGEESLEMMEALAAHMQAPTEETTQNLLLELGDVLWSTTAIASNSSCSIDDAVTNRLYEYVRGVGYLDDYDAPWRVPAGMLAVDQKPATIDAIDDLIEQHFEPLASPRMNIEAPKYGPDMNKGQHAHFIASLAVMLWTPVSYQYERDKALDMGVLPHSFDSLIDDGIAPFVAEIYLHTAYLAKKTMGMTLRDVMTHNKAKIDARVAAGLVDKTDGERANDVRL